MSEEYYGFDSDDFDTDFDVRCPKCESETRSRDCRQIGCNDGWIDEYEEDPLWFDPGDESECRECHGTGIVRWCPVESCDWEWHGEVIDRSDRIYKDVTAKPSTASPASAKEN